MLLYLKGHTCPDIARAVNCAAWYMFCPTKSHDETLKQIGRYLKATHNRGLIIKPSSGVLKIDAYLDANFAGMYGYERHDNPSCVKSWTSYVINVTKHPVMWQFKLQTKTVLSTMETEIVAILHCSHELIPIMQIVEFLGPAVGVPVDCTSMHACIHEDDMAALILANTLPPQHTPWFKHYHYKDNLVQGAYKKNEDQVGED
jgi:hypothetical protein